MGYALPQTIQMVDMTCPSCGVSYAMPASLRAEREKDGRSFYCVNGHSLSYHETEAMRLRKMLDAANKDNTAMAQQVRDAQLAEQRAVDEAKRIKRRVKAGVCPCCNRTFQNLARHMATKHKGA